MSCPYCREKDSDLVDDRWPIFDLHRCKNCGKIFYKTLDEETKKERSRATEEWRKHAENGTWSR